MIGVVSLQQSVEMLSHADILHWASTVPAYVATAVVLSAGAAAALTCGLLRSRAATRLWLPGVAFVTLSTAAIWPLRTAAGAWRLRGVLMGAAGVALLVDALACEKQRDESTGKSGAATGVSRLYLAIASLGAGMFLFSNLSGYSGDALLPWEASVTLGFGEAFTKGLSVVHFTLQRFLWDDGILSAGNTSLFYGAPTYALFHTAGFSPWTLRCAAVAATLLAMAVVFASNPCLLFYGRYGSSPAGTVLAVLLAVLATWLFLEREQSAWWRAVVCAALLYLATLQYSPGRIVVLILLGFIPIGLAYQWRQVGWRRLLGIAVIALIAVGVWRLEGSFQRQGLFLSARGETFFALLRSPAYIGSLYGGAVPPHIRPEALSVRDKIELLVRALKIKIGRASCRERV